ncbi:cupin domain-containing protein [Aestuariicoccus sp. MJ-SS9]|uniref:cupin domain-containing protein n=1 Tax=Aestuariicoccus sp. MJ-SS9 TaxID=3079855 RepID=UPI0029133BF9|nr:cupin domain-containing protein [Aestuariicoccus sp. MJ-SS9]MDU8909913.1 cupin domain-containing protein [Aestuariicoccus sp. MJ-SS9]
MPKIDIQALPVKTGSGYPAPLDREMEGRSQVRLGDPAGLTQFGVNLVRLEPGAKSSLRHWHETQDEFLVVTEGTLTLRDDHGDTPLHAGDCAAFPAGDRNGHHIVNLSETPGSFVVVGTRTETETAWYSDHDMKVAMDATGLTFTRRDGSDIEPAS